MNQDDQYHKLLEERPYKKDPFAEKDSSSTSLEGKFQGAVNYFNQAAQDLGVPTWDNVINWVTRNDARKIGESDSHND